MSAGRSLYLDLDQLWLIDTLSQKKIIDSPCVVFCKYNDYHAKAVPVRSPFTN